MKGLEVQAHLVLPCLTLLAFLVPGVSLGQGPEVKIGSKVFTESVILGDMIAHLCEDEGVPSAHRRELGGTRVLWDALLKGEIDVYPEYTGTISEEILGGRNVRGPDEMKGALGAVGVRMSRPLGFNDNYALGMKKEVAASLHIRRISDLVSHPDLAFGFSSEFMDRRDGWQGLRDRYHLPQRRVSGLEHNLAYRGLESGSIQVTDLYTTDAEISYYGLTVLDDDLHYFPVYDAVLLYRADLLTRVPKAAQVLSRLEGRISEGDMIEMNRLAKTDKVPETKVAADFLEKHFSVEVRRAPETMLEQIGRHTKEHLFLVLVSLAGAVVIAVPLGIVAAKSPVLAPVILGFAGVIQTIPSLALLVFMIPLLGIGGPPAMVALFLYSLLPIVRNTYTGLTSIPSPLRESAEALGLPAFPRLRLIELPLASREILAGIKTSAVINVGTATLGALIGAGGYGQPIITGIRLDNVGMILQGAVPAAMLALAVQGLFALVEAVVVPRGLKV